MSGIAIGWLEEWTDQLERAQAAANVRSVHEWMWSAWRRDGANIAAELNAHAKLGADANGQFQADIPHLFAGRVEAADLVFININPGWHKEANAKQNDIVARSEEESWRFCRELFTRLSGGGWPNELVESGDRNRIARSTRGSGWDFTA